MNDNADWFRFLSPLRLGPVLPLPRHGVTLVAILDPDPLPIVAFPLCWGIRTGRTHVTEIDGGRVDRIRVDHSGATPILILDGEEVIGAKQNRAFNASFLVAPGASVELPVSCVEERRWNHTSGEFSAPGRTVTSSIRSTKLRRVATSVVDRGAYESHQREVWTSVTRYLDRTQVTSATRSFAEAADTRQHQIDASLRRVPLFAGQVGMAAVDARGRLSLDVFGAPGLFNRSWSAIARGMLGDAATEDPPDDPREVVEKCLEALRASPPHRRKAPGLGDSLHVVAERHVAGAIAHDQRIYHLFAATAEAAW